MALSKLAKISTNLTQSDRVLNQVITNLNQIADDPLLNYYEAQDIHFADGESVLLNHRLGRPYKGWVITRLQNVTGAPAWTEVTEGESGTVDIKRQIRIRQTGGGNVVASVRVF